MRVVNVVAAAVTLSVFLPLPALVIAAPTLSEIHSDELSKLPIVNTDETNAENLGKHQMVHFNDLPGLVKSRVVQHLPVKDVENVAWVNRGMRDIYLHDMVRRHQAWMKQNQLESTYDAANLLLRSDERGEMDIFDSVKPGGHPLRGHFRFALEHGEMSDLEWNRLFVNCHLLSWSEPAEIVRELAGDKLADIAQSITSMEAIDNELNALEEALLPLESGSALEELDLPASAPFLWDAATQLFSGQLVQKRHWNALDVLVQEASPFYRRRLWMFAFAAGNNDEEGMRILLLRHPDLIDAEMLRGMTALNVAISQGHFSIAQLLLDHGAKINYMSMICACQHAPLDWVKKMLDLGGARFWNDLDHWGQPFSHYIVMNARDDALAAVLAHIGDVNVRDSNVNVDVRDTHGNTPLHHVAHARYRDRDVSSEQIPFKILDTLLQLLQAGADVNALNNSGQTPLHMVLARETGDYEIRAAPDLREELVAALLQNPRVRVDIPDAQGKTALDLVADIDDPVVRDLVQQRGVEMEMARL